MLLSNFFFQAEDGIRDRSPSRGLGDVYKRQYQERLAADPAAKATMAAAHAHYGAARWSLLSPDDRAACEARGLAGVLRDTGVAGLRDTSGAHVKCLHTMTAHRLAQIAAGDLDPSRANVVGQWALDALAAGEDAQAGRVVDLNT